MIMIMIGGGGVERSSNVDDGRDFLCIFFVIFINLSSPPWFYSTIDATRCRCTERSIKSIGMDCPTWGMFLQPHGDRQDPASEWSQSHIEIQAGSIALPPRMHPGDKKHVGVYGWRGSRWVHMVWYSMGGEEGHLCMLCRKLYHELYTLSYSVFCMLPYDI